MVKSSSPTGRTWKPRSTWAAFGYWKPQTWTRRLRGRARPQKCAVCRARCERFSLCRLPKRTERYGASELAPRSGVLETRPATDLNKRRETSERRQQATARFGGSASKNQCEGGFQMRKLKLIEHISLDGVIQHGEDGDFPYGDWTAPYRSPAGLAMVLAAQGESFDLLLGRRTYDLWSGFWPKAPSSPMSDRLNAATKYVATHRPESLEWGPFEGLGPDIVEGIRRIKSHNGPDVILWGSSTLTSTLLEHGLADEVMLLIYPVLVGKGKRFFAEGAPPRAFDHASTKALSSGIVMNVYNAAGPLNQP